MNTNEHSNLDIKITKDHDEVFTMDNNIMNKTFMNDPIHRGLPMLISPSSTNTNYKSKERFISLKQGLRRQKQALHPEMLATTKNFNLVRLDKKYSGYLSSLRNRNKTNSVSSKNEVLSAKSNEKKKQLNNLNILQSSQESYKTKYENIDKSKLQSILEQDGADNKSGRNFSQNYLFAPKATSKFSVNKSNLSLPARYKKQKSKLKQSTSTLKPALVSSNIDSPVNLTHNKSIKKAITHYPSRKSNFKVPSVRYKTHYQTAGFGGGGKKGSKKQIYQLAKKCDSFISDGAELIRQFEFKRTIDNLKHKDFLSTIDMLQELEFADTSVLSLLYNYKVDSEVQDIRNCMDVIQEYRKGVNDPCRQVARLEMNIIDTQKRRKQR